jgi:hypothetical protein
MIDSMRLPRYLYRNTGMVKGPLKILKGPFIIRKIIVRSRSVHESVSVYITVEI